MSAPDSPEFLDNPESESDRIARYARLGATLATRQDTLACGCHPMSAADHATGCSRNHWPHDECDPEPEYLTRLRSAYIASGDPAAYAVIARQEGCDR